VKLTATINHRIPAPSVCLEWQMPGTDHSTSLYLRPEELTPTAYPHAVKDLSRVAVFYGCHFVLFHAPDSLPQCDGSQDGASTARADVIHGDTFKLLAILRTLHERQVPRTIIDTARLRTVIEHPLLTVGQLSVHPNLRGREHLGRTLKYFQRILVGGDRTFAHLLQDLSRTVQSALVYCNGDEFYFDGRIPNGLGFNGGIIPHPEYHSYGIHT
jgi:hypothetical protein